MRPEKKSNVLLAITQSKAKMYEYSIPLEHHINIPREPARLFPLAIGLLGNVAVETILGDTSSESFLELKKNLEFSARFFDSYLQSHLEEELDSYLLILGASAYYLCDLPGSSIVLVNRIYDIELQCDGLEHFLLWILRGEFSKPCKFKSDVYSDYLNELSTVFVDYYNEGKNNKELLEQSKKLRELVYINGSSRQLLIIDLICAILKRRLYNSAWHCLPLYSGLDKSEWEEVLQKKLFIKEFWPAQQLIGENGVFKGESAVVQMPTSAGKTKATEIIIRSSFLSGRTNLAIIVAPFRALCNEIRNSLSEAFRGEDIIIDQISDVMQSDINLEEMLTGNKVLVMTPEKLLYVIRHVLDLSKNIGLIIYDEGHQFDNGTRGITYELLLTDLKNKLNSNVQTVLISAVISNAETVGNWLNGKENKLVLGTHLTPTYRTVAFTSWSDQLGRLQFVNQVNPDKKQFYVPRVIEEHELMSKGRERKRRVFPEKHDGKTVAAYLGLKLAGKGSVAIYCGTKTTVNSLCEKMVDAYDRGLTLTKPIDNSNIAEIQKIRYLYSCHLGNSDVFTKSADMGILTHHGNTPMGIRISVEHAIKEGLANFVICTSTLAQGVNLPIRYLIVTSIYQGTERIKVRDFHNLIGRAGRAGMHTEGSIIFADPTIYDNRTSLSVKDKVRWRQMRNILNPNNSEPSVSTILSLFEPLRSDDFKSEIVMEPLIFVQNYLEDPDSLKTLSIEFAKRFKKRNFTKDGLDRQISWKINIISAIESYMLSNWEEDLGKDEIENLATSTLAYYLANEEEKEKIIELFKLIAKNISNSISEVEKRRVYGKTLFGLNKSKNIEEWTLMNLPTLQLCQDIEEMLNLIWPIMESNIQNSTYKKCNDRDILKQISFKWINGESLYNILEFVNNSNAKLTSTKQERSFKSENIVEICENALAYEGTLVLGAIIEIIKFTDASKYEELIEKLEKLQKRLKYGVSLTLAVSLYELGFADRVVCSDLSTILYPKRFTRRALVKDLKQRKEEVHTLLNKYPSYFVTVLENIIN